MNTLRNAIARMRAEVKGELYGPETLQGMIALFEEYRRALKLAEHNRSGRNPRYPGNAGKKVGEALQRKADRLAASFPRFPEYLDKLER